jgi:hypothetical protein
VVLCPGLKRAFRALFYTSVSCCRGQERIVPLPLWIRVTYPHPVLPAWPHAHVTHVDSENGDSTFRKFYTYLQDYTLSQTSKILVWKACILRISVGAV